MNVPVAQAPWGVPEAPFTATLFEMPEMPAPFDIAEAPAAPDYSVLANLDP